MLRFMWSQRVRHDLVTEMNGTELRRTQLVISGFKDEEATSQGM